DPVVLHHFRLVDDGQFWSEDQVTALPEGVYDATDNEYGDGEKPEKAGQNECRCLDGCHGLKAVFFVIGVFSGASQDLTRLGAVLRTDDTAFLKDIHQPGGSGVSDPELPLEV